jgi:hypothetical protein
MLPELLVHHRDLKKNRLRSFFSEDGSIAVPREKRTRCDREGHKRKVKNFQKKRATRKISDC